MARTHFTRTGFLPACKHTFRKGNMTTPHAVSGAAFKAVPETEACIYCQNIFLKLRNEQRKRKGLAPVEKYNSPS